MRNLLIAGVSMLLASLLFSCSQGEKETQGFAFEQADITYLPPVYYGDTIPFEYTFANNNTKPLTIYEVIPSCGCTTGHYTQTTKPNGRGVVGLIFIPSKGMAGRKWRRTAFVKSSHGNQKLSFEVYVGKMPEK